MEGSQLRIAIIHARWNSTIIEPLVAGAKATLLKRGVKEQNIVIDSVAGSWELPIAVQRFVSNCLGGKFVFANKIIDSIPHLRYKQLPDHPATSSAQLTI